MIRRRSSSQKRSEGGFTLVEVVVVIVVVGILSVVIVPQLVGQEYRQLRHDTEAVADFLLMFAQRESLTQRPIALNFDDTEYVLSFWVLDYPEGGDRREGEWRQERAIRPVKFSERVELREVRVDGRPISGPAWPIVVTPGRERPTLEFGIGTDDRSARIVLYPHALSPLVVDDQNRDARQHGRQPIDLDAEGRSREDW